MNLEASQPAEDPTPAPPPRPYFTYGLIAFLLLVFAAELALNTGSLGELLSPSLSTLYLLGGADRQAVIGDGEYWRLLTAPMLHADLSHVGFNCLAFFLVSRRVEPVAGWQWTAATFALSAVCGAAMSITLNPANVITIGASGGVVGVFVLAIFVGTRMPPGRPRSRLISQATYGAISAVLPFLHTGTSTAGTQVDYAAHVGGMIGGLVVMAALASRLWPRKEVRPKGQRAALGVAAVYFVACALSTIPIVLLSNKASLIDPVLPTSQSDLIAQSRELIKKYPQDPRILMARGVAAEQQRNFAEAEGDFRAAITQAEKFGPLVPPSLSSVLTGMLASALVVEGKQAEAAAVAGPACSIANTEFATALRQEGLCVGVPVPAPPAAAAVPATINPTPPAHVDRNTGVVVEVPNKLVDPNAVLDDALTQMKQGKVNVARKELLVAFDALKYASSPVDPQVARNVQALLAVADYVEGYNGQANDLAKPICSFETSGVYATMLRQDGLCV